MTEEQKFLFDVKGWLLLPGVLSATECATIRQHLRDGGNGFTGPAQELLDHPAIIGILTEILSEWPDAEESYRFRCENSFVTIRKAGWQPGDTQRPHVVRPPHQATAVRYQCEGGRIFSALTRVVWELNPVRKGDGGTLFLSGTHKAKFAPTDAVLEPDNPFMESYECPEGSVFLFTESLLHAATAWRNPEVDRVALFNCYNSVWSQWHRLNLDPGLIETMPEKRRSLFRGVYAYDFSQRPAEENRVFSERNRAL